jgi:sugar lactone lactonase YvrE
LAIPAAFVRTNGIVFSADGKTLYVTDGGSLVAFDVTGLGLLTNRRCRLCRG